MKTILQKILGTDPERLRLFQRESLSLDLSETFFECLNASGISLEDASIKLGWTESHLQDVLNDMTDTPIKTVADMFTAIGVAIDVKVVSLASTIGLEEKGDG